MKKRLVALFLTLMLALALVVPALMEGGIALPANVSQLPENYMLAIPASGTSFMSPAPYAIVSKTDWAKETYRIPWKEFVAKDIMINGNYDISKIVGVKTESYLIVPKDGSIVTKGASDKLNAKTMASLSSIMTASNVEIFRLLEPAKKPTIAKPTFRDGDKDKAEEKDKSFAVYTLTGLTVGTIEYQKLGATEWTLITTPTLEIPLEEYKVEYYFRQRGEADKTGVSASVKVTVPALANAPSTKLDVAKGEIKLKKDWLIRIKYGNTTFYETPSPLTAAKTLSIGSDTDFDKGTIAATVTSIEYRVQSGKKAGSTWATLYLSVSKGETLSGSTSEYFTLGAKNIISVVGAIPVQIKNSKGVWKTVKSLKLTDFSTDGTVEVRMAGTKTKLPGASRVLKIDEKGKLDWAP